MAKESRSAKNKKISTSKKSGKDIKKRTFVDFYYMLPEETTAKAIARALLEGAPQYSEKIECWDEAGVLEILTDEDSSIDMERMELSEAELMDDFLAANQIKSVYSVHTDSEQIPELKTIFPHIVSRLGGLLCSDSDDFMPIIVKA